MELDPASRLSRRTKGRFASWASTALPNAAGELRGGVSSAVVSLGILLPLGLLPFAAFGPEGSAIGIRAAFVSAIVGGVVIALVGGGAIPGSGPRTSTTLILAGFVAAVAADPRLPQAEALAYVLALASLCVIIAGALQLAFALLRLGSIVTFVPLPVVAGFMDGVAILVIVAQVHMLFAAVGEGGAGGSLPAVAIAIATAGLGWIVSKRMPRAPWALLAIVAGTALYWLVTWLSAGAAGALLGAPAADLAMPLLSLPPAIVPLAEAHLAQLLTTAAVIAVIGSLENLLSAAGLDARLLSRHRPNRLLLGQGIGSIVSGFLGGLPAGSSITVQLAAHGAGARSSTASALICSLVLLVVMIAGAPLIALVPIAATVGVMLIVSLSLFDQWSHTVWRQVREGRRERDALWALATVALVCFITVLFGFVIGIVVGIVVSLALFIAAQNRSLVRAVYTAAQRSSRRIYPAEQTRTLRAQGSEVTAAELEGAIFFGTAHRVERALEEIAAGVRCLIVDLSRVTLIDASGALAFERLHARVRARGTRLVLSGIVAGDRHARALHAHGALTCVLDCPWHPDVDRALEQAELELLQRAGQIGSAAELTLAAVSLFDGLDDAQRGTLAAHLERRELAAREVLFRRGEPGDRLFVLVRGSVSMLASDDGRGRRLATFAPGVVFGEAAMLDGGGRTATGIADEASVVHILTRAGLDAIAESDPALALAVLRNVAVQLSSRLRFANATIESVG